MDRCTGQLVDAQIHLNLSIGAVILSHCDTSFDCFESWKLKWKEQWIHYISSRKLGNSRPICFVLVLKFRIPNTLFGWLLWSRCVCFSMPLLCCLSIFLLHYIYKFLMCKNKQLQRLHTPTHKIPVLPIVSASSDPHRERRIHLFVLFLMLSHLFAAFYSPRVWNVLIIIQPHFLCLIGLY